jgi:hypothetical protein
MELNQERLCYCTLDVIDVLRAVGKENKFLFIPDRTIVCIGKFFTDTSDCIGQYWTYYDTDTELMIV